MLSMLATIFLVIVAIWISLYVLAGCVEIIKGIGLGLAYGIGGIITIPCTIIYLILEYSGIIDLVEGPADAKPLPDKSEKDTSTAVDTPPVVSQFTNEVGANDTRADNKSPLKDTIVRWG